MAAATAGGAKKGLGEILKLVPKVSFAVAYGSAVVKQDGYAGSSMVDYIFAVDDPKQWHSENFSINGYRHYSPLGALGGRGVAYLQDLGAGVYFNVPKLEDGEAKYAVIQTDRLCNELRCWNDLYVSGRLQKPVATLVHNDKVADAIETNLANALHAALLCLPERFSETDLYTGVASLSYMGDPRMTTGGEHPRKPHMIASGQEEAFNKLYYNAIKSTRGIVAVRGGQGGCVFEQDISPSATGRLYASLPQSIIDLTASELGGGGITGDAARGWVREAIEKEPGRAQPLLQYSISAIVAPAAKVQMVKGLFSFGAATAAKYVLHKIKRALAKR